MANLSPISGSPASTQNEIIVAPAQQAGRNQGQAIKPKSKPRKRVTTDEKRSQHNAIERARRNTLNGRFSSLGRLIPSLASHRNPSKSAVVNGSISHVTYQREQRLLAAKNLRRLCADNEALIAELNHWRKMCGQPPKEAVPTWNSEIDEICAVEKEAFGTFDIAEGDDEDNDDMNDMSFDQPSFTSSGFGNANGLITPRSSTELDLMAHQQAMYNHGHLAAQTLAVPDKRSATINGISWSNDFASSVNGSGIQRQNSMSTVASAPASLPFPSVMSDPLDQSSSTSPSNSHQGVVLTPPTTADFLYTHTPSPASTQSLQNDDKVPGQLPVQWNQQQQLLFLQQQAMQHSQQQYLGMDPSTAFGYMQSHAASTNAGFSNETFEQMLAGMFPNGSANSVQLQQWCKDVVQHAQHSQGGNTYKPTMPAGMNHGLNMSAAMWNDVAQVAEGF